MDFLNLKLSGGGNMTNISFKFQPSSFYLEALVREAEHQKWNEYDKVEYSLRCKHVLPLNLAGYPGNFARGGKKVST